MEIAQNYKRSRVGKEKLYNGKGRNGAKMSDQEDSDDEREGMNQGFVDMGQ